MQVRPATKEDGNALWAIIEPVIREGETWALPREWRKEEALAYWLAFPNVYVAEENAKLLGTYYLRPNQMGGGSHVANCGYMVAQDAQGKGMATALCRHSMEQAKAKGFKAMQYNFVVGTNVRAVRLWQHLGFEIVARLKQGFDHPTLGLVDALVMYRLL